MTIAARGAGGCEGGGQPTGWLAGEMAGRLLARAAEIAGEDGLRCLVSYRAIAMLAEDVRERQHSQDDITTIERILDHLAEEPDQR
jgi:hypothetical protein